MRLRNLILGELRLLSKYGIVFLYVIFTMIYLCLLAWIPYSARKLTACILVFTDPAAMGLFFMGAMVLLEKSQRVDSSLSVSPITIREYIIAKSIPYMVIGTLVSLVIGVFAAAENMPVMLLGVALSSVLFSLCGLLVGENSKTLNHFMIAAIPFEIVLLVPAILYVFGMLSSEGWMLHPGIAAIRLIHGELRHWYVSAFSIVLWIGLTYSACRKAVIKSFSSMGGAKI